MDELTIVGLGEVLWDILPAGRQLGGAPANFAYHAHALGGRGVVASRVGNDPLGREVLDRLAAIGLSCEHVQVDSSHPTGTVTVQLDPAGKPQYVIHEGVAWDHVQWTSELEQLAQSAACVCVGSLAQRSPDTRHAIRRFLAATPAECLRIFDVNLRQSYFNLETVLATLAYCQVVKFNDDEWPVLADLLDLSPGLPGGLEAMRRRFDLRLIALTKGPQGSLLWTAEGPSTQPPRPVKVADTVGAGDAFTAALALGLLRDRPLAQVHAHAAAVAAYVCTQQGATPPLPADLRRRPR